MGRRDVQRFYRFHAPIYNWTRPFFLWGRRKAIELLDVRSGHLVLDLGCGTGLNFPHLLCRRPEKILGVDLSRSMLRRARGKSPLPSLLLADLGSLPLKGKADRALCTYALSMLENPEKALGEIAESLAPDGRLVLLDFHPFAFPFTFLNPVFSWWLSFHHVCLHPPPLALLGRHFQNVEVQVPKLGYFYLLRARKSLQPSENLS